MLGFWVYHEQLGSSGLEFKVCPELQGHSDLGFRVDRDLGVIVV